MGENSLVRKKVDIFRILCYNIAGFCESISKTLETRKVDSVMETDNETFLSLYKCAMKRKKKLTFFRVL